MLIAKLRGNPNFRQCAVDNQSTQPKMVISTKVEKEMAKGGAKLVVLLITLSSCRLLQTQMKCSSIGGSQSDYATKNGDPSEGGEKNGKRLSA